MPLNRVTRSASATPALSVGRSPEVLSLFMRVGNLAGPAIKFTVELAGQQSRKRGREREIGEAGEHYLLSFSFAFAIAFACVRTLKPPQLSLLLLSSDKFFLHLKIYCVSVTRKFSLHLPSCWETVTSTCSLQPRSACVECEQEREANLARSN